MPDTAPVPTYHYQVNSTAIVTIGGRQLQLTMTSQDTTGDYFSVALLPGAGALDLTALLNQILTATFDLHLPAFVPDLSIDTVSGTVFRAADAAKPPLASYYSLSVQSKQLVGAPFGSHIPISISDFSFSADSESGMPAEVIASGIVHTTVISAVGALLVLTADGGSLIGISLTETVSIATLVEQVLGLSLGDEVASLLPSFSPASTSAPMRFYQASEAISVTTSGQTANYLPGFNVDNVVVSLVGYSFGLTLQVDDGFSVTASLPALNLGIVELVADPAVPPLVGTGQGGPLVNVVDKAGDVSVLLATQLNFFPGNNPLSFPLTAAYDSGSGVFSGTITINQKIFGVEIGALGIAWDEENGFRITNFPIPFDQLGQFIDFGKEINNYLKDKPDSDCPWPDVEMEFNELIQTEFTVNVALTAAPGLQITGSYVLRVAGYVVDTITFAPVVITLRNPLPTGFDDLGTAIVNALQDAAQALAGALVANVPAFMKFLGLVSLTQATEQFFNQIKDSFVCRYNDEGALQDSIGDSGSSATSAAEGGSLATLAGAADVFVAATAALAFFASIIKCLTGEQKKENEEAQQRYDQANAAIQAFLEIDSVNPVYGVSGDQIFVDVSWSWAQPGQVASGVTAIVAVGSVQQTVSARPSTARLFLPAGSAGQTLAVSVTGQFSHNNSTYGGMPAPARVTIPALAVATPAAAYQGAQNSLPVTWTATPSITLPGGGVASVTSYTVALWNMTSGQVVPGMQATLPPPSQGNQLAYSFDLVPATPPLFWPDENATYQVQISLASTMQPLVAPPWVSPVIPILGGIGHTLVGLTLEVAPARQDSKEDPS